MGRNVGAGIKEEELDALALSVQGTYNLSLQDDLAQQPTWPAGRGKRLGLEAKERDEEIIFYTYHENSRNVAPVYALSNSAGQKSGLSERQRSR